MAASDLTEAQIEGVREAFQLFDLDSDGLLAIAELGTVLRALAVLCDLVVCSHVEDLNPTEAEVESILKDYEGKGIAQIGFPDFLALFAIQQQKLKTPEELAATFQIFDRDGTGMVQASELRHVLRSIGEPLDEESVESLMSALTIDSNGLVPIQSLIQVLIQPPA